MRQGAGMEDKMTITDDDWKAGIEAADEGYAALRARVAELETQITELETQLTRIYEIWGVSLDKPGEVINMLEVYRVVLAAQNGYNESLDEALNSGDGVYRP